MTYTTLSEWLKLWILLLQKYNLKFLTLPDERSKKLQKKFNLSIENAWNIVQSFIPLGSSNQIIFDIKYDPKMAIKDCISKIFSKLSDSNLLLWLNRIEPNITLLLTW